MINLTTDGAVFTLTLNDGERRYLTAAFASPFVTGRMSKERAALGS